MSKQKTFAESLVDLQPKIGDYFTVLRWIDRHDNSYKGDCFEIIVVDQPFIRARCHSGYFKGHTITLDLRAVEIMPLSPEFVADVKGQFVRETQPSQPH